MKHLVLINWLKLLFSPVAKWCFLLIFFYVMVSGGCVQKRKATNYHIKNKVGTCNCVFYHAPFLVDNGVE